MNGDGEEDVGACGTSRTTFGDLNVAKKMESKANNSPYARNVSKYLWIYMYSCLFLCLCNSSSQRFFVSR